MIYKFIDNNGAEITVNSFSSLQALVDSETIKENTKVKAGLRGKWATAKNIPDLKFKEEKVEEPPKEGTEDIIDIITRASEPTPPPEVSKKSKKEEVKTKTETKKDIEKEKIVEEKEVKSEEITEPESKTTTDEVISKTEDDKLNTEDDKLEAEYGDEKMEDINFFQSIKICFQKFFIFAGRASRSEYWWFYLFYIVTGAIPSSIPNELVMAFGWIMIILLFIPSLAAAVRRLHDVNTSGWFILIAIIPVLGAIIVLVKIIGKGTLGKNRFGEYPLKFKKGK